MSAKVHLRYWLLATLILGALTLLGLSLTQGNSVWASDWEPAVPSSTGEDDPAGWEDAEARRSATAPITRAAAERPDRRVVTNPSSLPMTLLRPAAPSGALTGLVRDNLGNPVPDAVVRVYPAIPPGQRDRNVSPIADEVRTNTEGRFHVSVPIGEDLTVQAEHHGFATADPIEHIRSRPGVEELPPLVLRVGRVLRGRVQEEAGPAIAGAVVQVRRSAANPLVAAAVSGRIWQTTTDGNGGFVFRSLPEAEFRVQVTPPAPWAQWARDEVTPSGDELLVQVRRGTGVSGRVLDAVGRPLAEVSLCLLPEDGDGVPTRAASAADGTFRFQAMPQGSYRLRVSAAGCQSTELSPLVLGDAPKALDAITLRSRPRVRVLLATPEAARPTEARIEFLAATPTGALGAVGLPPVDVRVVDGQAVLPGPEPGSYALLVQADGLAPAVSGVLHATDTGADQELVVPMTPGARIRGKVLTAAGEPASQLLVEAWPTQFLADRTPDFLRHAMVPTVLRPRAFTNANGVFVLGGLGPGRWELSVRGEGALPGAPESVEVRAGADWELPRPLRLLDGAAVEGVAVDPDGIPLRGSEIELVPRLGDDAPATSSQGCAPATGQRCRTDANGRFALRGVPPGAYWISTARRSSRGAMPVYADHERSRKAIDLEAGKTQRDVHLQIR